MKDDIEHVVKDQSRWNDAYGKANLEDIQISPDKFIVDPTKLPRQQLDILHAMSDIKEKRILEYGSGRGEFSTALAKLGAIVIGIDLGEDLVRLSKTVAELNNVKVDFVVGSIDELYFDNGIFDFVVGNNILHHLTRRGVVDSLKEAFRVLKPGGVALFTEPIEDSKIFDFIQNLFPIGKPHALQSRPSILQREEWKRYLREADDRSLSSTELMDAKGSFKEIEFEYYGLLIRLIRLFPNAKFRELMKAIDSLLTHKYSPIRKLSQSVLVIYRK